MANSGNSRVDKIVEQQQKAIETFTNFVEKAADLTLKGEFKPSELVKEYATMWKELGKQIAEITRIALKD
jgi:hypothetical protein